MKTHRSSMRGNVMFWVLIAIALFGYLAYAVTRTGSVSTQIQSKEQTRLIASELVAYGNGVRLVVDKMLRGEGVQELNTSGNGILFSATSANAAYGVPEAQPRTEVFSKSGGGFAYQTPPAEACSGCAYEFTGQILVTGVGSDTRYELAMVLPGLTAEVCEQINTLQRHGWSSIPTEAPLTLARFSGTNYGDTGGSNPLTLTGAANEFVGKKSFCYRENAAGQRYVFVYVLKGR